ncbi:MAG: sorbosone dehydrogenase family protein [Chitinophagaceae bacterium]|nr:sorbosone dehydrogenase family protein [Chitinophagaceae bacterium]
MTKISTPLLVAFIAIAACGNRNVSKTDNSTSRDIITKDDSLPAPFATKSVRNSSRVIGWPANAAPTAPAGFTVTRYAENLHDPRWIYVADNGDVFIAESKSGEVILLRDNNKDGVAETKSVYLNKLRRPLGMLVVGSKFYVANTDGVEEYAYDPKATSISAGSGKKIVELPAGGYNNHWTRNIITNPQKNKLYISVGSGSNVAEHGMEHEARRAGILEVNLDGTGEKIYASGLRNPVGMDWAPGTNMMWTAVNERDGLGDDLVPDYITSVKEGGFYGWPYAYFGKHEDPRRKGERPDLVAKTIVPDVPTGSHTASLGLTFYTKNVFPAKYQGGVFVGQHGSWNRSTLSGYKVIFVPFKNGQLAGQPEDFLTGFIADESKSEVYGRPVAVVALADGSLLVSDDGAKIIWRVSYKK